MPDARAATLMRPVSSAGQRLLQAAALDAAEQVLHGHAHVVEDDLARLGALVAELGDVLA